MCGFFFIKKKKPFNFNIKTLNLSSELLKHRGPDAKKTFTNNNIFIKFFRLNIQDQSSNGMQPMISRSGKNIIVFNGEIYNFKELKKYLKNQNLKSNSDTEVLLNLYEEMGTKIFDHIKGMFSFLIYNFETEKILAARDQFGIKPLYYYDAENFTIFSSEIKPILNYIKKTKINNNALAEYFFLGKQDHYSKTFFQNIKSVEPSHYYNFNTQSIKKYRYWSLYSDNKHNLNTKKNIDKLYNLLTATLDRYLISDRKIGVFLSSGIDSTSLASLISRKTNYKINSFTYDFKNNFNFGESKYAKINAKKLNIYNENFFLKPSNVINEFDSLTKTLESPFTSLRLFAINGLYKKAKEKNHSVIVEGAGGDEILGGYSYNILPYLIDKYQSTNKIINALMDLALKSKKNTETELLNRIITLNLQGASTTDATPFIDIDCFNHDFLNAHLNEKFYKLDKKNIVDLSKMNMLQKSQIQDIQEVKLPRNLKFADRISMSHGIETRLPLLDIDIASFCFNLNNEMKLRNNTNRWIMKEALKKIKVNIKFPINKMNIADPQRQWLKNELKEFFLDNINSLDFKNSGLFNPKYINKKFSNFLKNESNETSFQFFQILSSYKFVSLFK